MIRYLTLEEFLELHRLVLEQTRGLTGVRDLGALESALAQPHMTFGGLDLYPSMAEQTRVRLTVEPIVENGEPTQAWESFKSWIGQNSLQGLGRRLTRAELHERH